MRALPIVFPLLAFVLTPIYDRAAAQEALAITWGPLTALPEADRTLAAVDAQYALDLADQVRAARLQLNSVDLLLLTVPTLGNCGEFYLTIWGPRAPPPADAAGGVGNVIGRARLYWECQSDVVLRPAAHGDMPDMVLAIGGFAERILHWDGTGWGRTELVERASMRNSAGAFDLIDGDLAALVATAPRQALGTILRGRAVRATLSRGFAERYPDFLAAFAVRGPPRHENDCLVFTGVAPHAGGSWESALAACQGGTLHAALLSDGHLMLLSREPDTARLPPALKAFLARARGAGQPAPLHAIERLAWPG